MKRFFLLSSCLYFLILLSITYPLFLHLGSMSYGLGDELLVAYIHSFVQHSLETNPLSLFQANIYYPYANTLAYSEPFILTSILTYLPMKILKEPIAATNLVYLFSLFSLALSVCATSFYLTRKYLPSFLSGMLILFCPYIIDKAVHVQVILCFFVPLSWICFLHCIKTKKHRYLTLFFLCLVFQMYTSLMPGYFIIISVLLMFSWISWKKREIIKIFLHWKVGIMLLLSLVTILPVVLPYLSVSQEFSYVRDLRDTIHFALQPEDLLYPNEHTRLRPFLSQILVPPLDVPPGEVKSGYIGAVFTLLFLFSSFYVLRHKIEYASLFLFISVSGLLLSFGPFLHLARQTIHNPFPIPLPYLPLYYLLPGLAGFRNSSRFEMLFILAGAVLIALVLAKVLERKTSLQKNSIYLLLLAGIVLEFNTPMKFYPVPQTKDFPQVYTSIKALPQESVIIELPIYNWNMSGSHTEIYREYYSTTHFRRMVNGYSGFSPPPWQKLVEELNETFSVSTLKSLGVDYIIFHKKEYDDVTIRLGKGVTGDDMFHHLMNTANLHLIQKIGDDYIFQIK